MIWNPNKCEKTIDKLIIINKEFNTDQIIPSIDLLYLNFIISSNLFN